MRPGVRLPVEAGLGGQHGVHVRAGVGVATGHDLTGIGVGRPVVGDTAGAVGVRLVRRGVGAARTDAVEQHVQPDAGLLFPVGHVGHVGRAHLHVGRHARRGPRRDPLVGDRAVVVRRVGGRRGALELRAPLVVGDEDVVDVLAEVVAVQAQVGVLGHPVDQAGGQQQPLQLIGVVVEVERELGHPGLRVAARMLVHARQGVPGGVGDERRVGGPGVHRGPVAVTASVKRDGPFELGEGGQAGSGQGPGGAIQGTSGRFGHAQGRGGVHVAVELAHAEGGLIGVQRGQLPRGIVARGIRDDDAVVVADVAAGQRRQADGLSGGRTRSGDQGERHPSLFSAACQAAVVTSAEPSPISRIFRSS